MNEELKKQIEELTSRIKNLEATLQVPDHSHNGFDNSRIKIKDIDTIHFKQAVINPGNLADGAGETIQVTNVDGATLGDWVLISAPYDLQDITVTAYVQANSVVEIRIQNESGGAIDLASGTWRILIIKKIL